MSALPPVLSGLSAVAGEYDALICDVWGVLHDGVTAHEAASDALIRFRRDRGRVVLLSNSPRLPGGVDTQLRGFGVPAAAYDAIVTSGGAVRAHLDTMSRARPRLKIFAIGPDRDDPTVDGLNIERVGAADAELVLCTGPFDDEDTPDDYVALLTELKTRNRPFVCANPDIVVQRGADLHYCAGALARLYESMGGDVAYFGKPHAPIYQSALATLGGAVRVLAIGDGLETDIKGANAMGIDALFIGGGIHGQDSARIGELFAREGVSARAIMDRLAW